MIKIADQII